MMCKICITTVLTYVLNYNNCSCFRSWSDPTAILWSHKHPDSSSGKVIIGWEKMCLEFRNVIPAIQTCYGSSRNSGASLFFSLFHPDVRAAVTRMREKASPSQYFIETGVSNEGASGCWQPTYRFHSHLLYISSQREGWWWGALVLKGIWCKPSGRRGSPSSAAKWGDYVMELSGRVWFPF